MGLECQLVTTALQRNGAHVFEFGLQPEPVALTDLGSLPETLGIEDVLHPGDLFCPIVHRTYKSGWCVRALTTDELGVAFGFLVWLQTGGLSISDFPCVPLQILDSCLRSILGTKEFASPRVARSVPVPLVSSVDSTYLPLLWRYLPHSWIATLLITAKAAEHDNAQVEHAMWDQQILLVLPWALSILLFLRRRLMSLIWIRLQQELRAHL